MHIFLVGEPGVGKSFLIERLLQLVQQPVYGFRTKKREEAGGLGFKVYIHPAGGPVVYGDDNTVGIHDGTGGGMRAVGAVFETVGVGHLTGIPASSVVLMDELGFLESSAPAFCRAVLEVLDGPYQVLAAVKPLDTPFLRSVRAHPGAQIYRITEENRDALYATIQADLRGNAPGSPFMKGARPGNGA